MAGGNYSRQVYRELEKMTLTFEKTQEELKKQIELNRLLVKSLEIKLKREELLNEVNLDLKEQVKALKKEVERLNQILGNDSTNSGLPTSHTPLHKQKHIPNSRIKSGKKKGGQPGHSKHSLPKFCDEEVNSTEIHKMDSCPNCEGKLEYISEGRSKDELDYEVVLIKKRHFFPIYQCQDCHKKISTPIPKRLKQENQYGPQVQATALTWMNEGNVPIQKTQQMLSGFSFGMISPSEGYLAKLQQRAADGLTDFLEDMRRHLLTQPLIYWDDTVIMVNKNRACLRFYGDERLALYKAHPQKNKEGILNDQLLGLLPKQTVVMHDHNRVNYGEEFSYSDIECNAHLLRDLQKCSDNTKHQWSTNLASLIRQTHRLRNEKIEAGEDSFTELELSQFFLNAQEAMVLGNEENQKDQTFYYAGTEKALLKRLVDYWEPYFSWVLRFDLPFTNNVSERGLRGVKSKMKISGQFQHITSAKNYAAIRSYCETCRRNGVNPTVALKALAQGTPFTLKQILQ